MDPDLRIGGQIEPEFREPGSEYLGFTFSQAVHDIRASIDYLATDFDARSVVLATFSLSSIEARRAIATDYSGRVGGWVSVVGPADLQSRGRRGRRAGASRPAVG